MRLVSFRGKNGAEAGIVADDYVLPLADIGYRDVLTFLSAGESACAAAELFLVNAATRIPLAQSRLLAPIPRPSKILCIGLNYRDHAAEAGMEIPAVPTVFTKFSTAVIGPGQAIVIPPDVQQPDYEAEFAFVIGKRARRVSREHWREYVFGYTILNDVSARDLQFTTSQWSLAKSLDTFAPMGPHIVTADEIPDPGSLEIQLRIGDEVLQHSNTRHLIFGVPELVEYLSGLLTLEPGDVISTGTPSGVGLARKPQRWLRHGEEVVVEIERIGVLRNPVKSEIRVADAVVTAV